MDGDTAFVSVKLLVYVYTNDCIDGQVIDIMAIKVRTKIMKRKQIVNDATIFSTNIFDVILTNNQEEISDYIMKQLRTLEFRQNDYVFFPINHKSSVAEKTGSHWTLLTYNLELNRWCFYNSSRSKNKKGEFYKTPKHDTHLADAMKLKGHFMRCLRAFYKEINSRDASRDTDIEYPSCPQQQPGSVDCGVFVLGWMSSIMSGGDPTIENMDILRIPASIVRIIVINKKSGFWVTSEAQDVQKPYEDGLVVFTQDA